MSDVTVVSQGEFEENKDSGGGFCTNCKEFTNFSGVEPDAEGYRCDQCDEETVVGAEQALILGLIEFGDDEE